jgi:tRNA(His) 5'-end guanylyltransferase
MSKSDSLGDRMKVNFEVRTRTFLPRRTNTIIRLDGKAFHTYTRGLERPYDLDFMSDMDETAKFLCENIQGCKLAYVQSDEISLLLTDFEDITTEAWFDGNVQKMVSISASMAAARFNQLRFGRLMIPKIDEVRARHTEFGNKYDWAHLVVDINPLIYGKLAFFDSRVFTIPDPIEVENMFIWRQQDATRNSIQMAAQSMFTHKEMHGVNCNQLQEKMWTEKQVNWNDYPEGFKRGRCVVKETYMADIPSSKSGRTDYSQLQAERTRWKIEAPPIFTQDRDYIRRRFSK